MRIGDRVRDWPVEEWAASAARLARRVRRRAARRRGSLAGVAIAVVMAGAVAGNALWRQDEPHPAPLWGEAQEVERTMAVAAHGDRDTDQPAPRRADGSSLVGNIQRELAASGYYAGPVTGVLDEATRAGIRAFERAQGLPETGEPSVGLLAAVTSGVRAVPSPEEPEPVDLDVADIQRLLNERGYGPLAVDGVMGPNTRSALRRFAEAEGLDTADARSPSVLRALAGGGA